jgi:heme-degrading monooxygenase HmoA
MVWGKLRPGSWEVYERHYYERVVPSSKGIKGLQERQLLRSTEDPDEGISLSIWDTLENMHNYDVSERRQELAKELEHLYRGEYSVTHFEVKSSNR